METQAELIDSFSDRIVVQNSLHIAEKRKRKSSTVISVVGERGMVDVEFYDDGEIYAEFENDDVFHSWSILPSKQDIIALVRKIGNFIGRDK